MFLVLYGIFDLPSIIFFLVVEEPLFTESFRCDMLFSIRLYGFDFRRS